VNGKSFSYGIAKGRTYGIDLTLDGEKKLFFAVDIKN